jgi:enamine deaminase RidA (YjgF/YER057c/UK114 family)
VAKFPAIHNVEEIGMARRLISSGSKFEADIGYSRAVVDGEWVLVSGTTGFNYATMTIEDDVVALEACHGCTPGLRMGAS